MEYLLRQRNIEVNVKDKKGNRTPLFCAIKAGDEESVVFLIANGADLEQKVAGKNLNDYLRSKMPHIDPHAISIVKPKLEKQTSVSTLEKLKDMIEDLQVTFSEKRKKCLFILALENFQNLMGIFLRISLKPWPLVQKWAF